MRTGARNKDERKAVDRCISGQSNEHLVTQKRPPHQVTHVFKFTKVRMNSCDAQHLRELLNRFGKRGVNRKKLKIQEQPSSLKGDG